jgi:hypothetical protein
VTASSAGSRICRWLGIRCSCGAGPALPLPPGRLRAGDLLPDTSRLAGPGASTTRRCARFVLRRLVVDRAMVAAVARELGRSWDTINTIACEATTDLLAAVGAHPHRAAHHRPEDPAGGGVRRRRPRPGRGDLAGLPADHHRLRPPRSPRRQDTAAPMNLRRHRAVCGRVAICENGGHFAAPRRGRRSG